MLNANDDVQEAEVLPPAGSTQWASDLAYKFGGFVKGHAISLTIGVALGILLCYMINNKK